MTSNTTEPSYWLNWRFFLCGLAVLSSMVAAALSIWRREAFLVTVRGSGRGREEESSSSSSSSSCDLRSDEAWSACLKGIHPVWLLAYRIVAFVALFSLLFANVLIDGAGIFYFYTQWTFSLVIIYFGLGSVLSIYGCRKYASRVGGDAESMGHEEERSTYVAPTLEENLEAQNLPKSSVAQEEERHSNQPAGAWNYVFQIIFQVSAGAVLLTDCVFWLILYPFLTSRDYKLNFLMVCMHSLNAFFLFGDTLLNCLRFPLFRISYFVLWTGTFVVFQWIIHACVSMWWPYPFLDLSSPYSPLWYMGVGLMHIPCYGIYALIIRIKNAILSRLFPGSLR